MASIFVLVFLAIYINIIIWGLIFVGFEFLYSQEWDIFVIEFSGEKFITIFWFNYVNFVEASTI